MNQEQERTLFIGFLNADCAPDTVRGGRIQGGRGYLPSVILWGQPAPANAGKTDPACASITPMQKRVRKTHLVYPAWTLQKGSAAFHSINNDTLTDIVLHLHERITQGAEETETLHALVLFGQHGLDSLPVIRIGEIRRFQAEPFFAMELAVGSELTQPGTRDLSGAMSYVLEPVTLKLDEPIPHPAAPVLAGTGSTDGSRPAVQVYPNPTANTIRVEAARLAAGEYRLRLLSVNGTVEQREEITIASGEVLHRTLDVQQIPSGTYVVHIETDAGESISITPIIITH